MTTSPTTDVAAGLRARILMLGDSPEQMMEFMNGITPLLAESADLIEHQAKALSEEEESLAALKQINDSTALQASKLISQRNDWETRALAAEAHLAEAMKVIEPFAAARLSFTLNGDCTMIPASAVHAARAFASQQEPSDAS